jgi:hypothetical protein
MRLPVESLVSGWVALVAGAAAIGQIHLTNASTPMTSDRIESFIISFATLVVLGVTSFFGARDRKRNQVENQQKLDSIGKQTNGSLTKLSEELKAAHQEVTELKQIMVENRLSEAVAEIAELKKAVFELLPGKKAP